ncbi:MAG: glycosyltransferase family 2 protein [Cyanobacteriota bacterium]|nr:glycosyltransferase family 2 protein [Cyanobacteriota bacterium]
MGGDSANNRRPQAALVLLGCVVAGAFPHWLSPLARVLPGLTLGALLAGHVGRVIFFRPDSAVAGPLRSPTPGDRASTAAAVASEAVASAPAITTAAVAAPSPAVDVVVAARDEEAVIGSLVERVLRLRWPADQLRLWVVDDGSEDRTPQRLAELQSRHPQLRVLRRARDCGGGKSGALNAVLEQLGGRWLLVLDADADLPPDLLERVIPFAELGGWGAVQLRKAEANAAHNWLTRAQAMEMAFDAFIQEARLARGGVTELRGNGQLLRLDAVQTVGGFNEATITDDLDLSFRFLLAGLPIGVLWDPPVSEEAVTTLPALWRQRQRWAEGGLQRFLDYGNQLLSSRLNGSQRWDLGSFFILQYLLPMMVVADLFAAALTKTLPGMWPFPLIMLTLSGFSLTAGCRRGGEGPPLPPPTPGNVLLTVAYLMHWFVVIPWVMLKMALLPKTLVWQKTMHAGADAGVASPMPPYPDFTITGPGQALDLDDDIVVSTEG